MRWWLVCASVLAGCGVAPTAQASSASFLALGDSITADAFASPDAWLAVWGANGPVVLDEGFRGQTSDVALPKLRELLPAHPDALAVGIAFGTNDVLKGNDPASFQTMLAAAVDYAKAQGRTPRLATIPYSAVASLAAVPRFNEAVQAVAREKHLPPGPDLYAWFKAHPEQHGPDGIHMGTDGSRAIQRLWALALQGLAP